MDRCTKVMQSGSWGGGERTQVGMAKFTYYIDRHTHRWLFHQKWKCVQMFLFRIKDRADYGKGTGQCEKKRLSWFYFWLSLGFDKIYFQVSTSCPINAAKKDDKVPYQFNSL